MASYSPGSSGRVWGGVPAREDDFTGREEVLRAVREALTRDPGVLALRGSEGVGKTQIAAEYAHRHAADYDVVWWLNAEHAGLLGEQFAALADRLDVAEPGTPLNAVRRALLSELRERPRWLLIFDDAQDPRDVRDWLPGGQGHVLITSRASGWDELAVTADVDVLARAESTVFLRGRVAGLSEADAAAVADAVGDLPLALAQAAGYLTESGMPAAEYLSLLRNRIAYFEDWAKIPPYPPSLGAVTGLAYDWLRSADETAGVIAGICAFLAPAPVPAEWFGDAPAEPPDPPEPPASSEALDRLVRSSLARRDPAGLVMHPLTQAVIRGPSPSDESAFRALAEQVVVANHPGDPGNPDRWPAWARLLPHLLAMDPATTRSEPLQREAIDAAWYLALRGDTRGALALSERLFPEWKDRFGRDNEHTLMAAALLASLLRDAGDNARALDLDGENLARYRRLLGDDHPATLLTATNLALDLRRLGNYQAALQLTEDTLARRRQALGDDHPATLTSASNLAADLYALGDHYAARELAEDTLERRRRVLGDRHPDTVSSARNLARIRSGGVGGPAPIDDPLDEIAGPETMTPEAAAPPAAARPAQAPPAQAPAAPAPPEVAGSWSGSAAGPGDTTGIEEPPPRYLTGILPERAPSQLRISLLVQVTLASTGSAAAPLKAFAVPVEGSVITITVSAPGLMPMGDLEQDLSVPGTGDSEPIRFSFMTGRAGLHTVTVRAFSGGTFLGELALQISVEVGAALEEGPGKAAVLTGLAAEPGEVTLQVSRTAENKYSFQLIGETLYPVALTERLAGDPTQVVGAIVEELRSISAKESRFSRPELARNRIRNLGAALWADVVPETIRRQFWAQAGRIKLFTVASDNDIVPWELLYPVDGDNDNGFLVEQFPVVRRVYGQGRVRNLRLTSAAYVVPPGSPANAMDEVLGVRGLLPQDVSDWGVHASLDKLIELIETAPSLLHFACHNSFTEKSGSVITLEGGPLRPTDLAIAVQKHGLARVSPLVFLNACRTAGEVPGLVQMMGWASQFMAAGAGAFVGSLWAVRSSSAKAFAEEFYRALVSDRAPLGAASLRARQAIAAESGDPTWLAYTVYGNPSATVDQS